jgi:hypothetical protein
MKGLGLAYMVESKACRAKGRIRPRTSFHRYFVAARFSALQLMQGSIDGSSRWLQTVGVGVSFCFLAASARRMRVIIMAQTFRITKRRCQMRKKIE